MDQLLHDELKHMCETRRDIDTTERSKARWNAIIALIDAALAEPKKLSTCPECGGSGVYQEYDEYDRYTVHACAKCGGSGELLAEPDADVAGLMDNENTYESLMSRENLERIFNGVGHHLIFNDFLNPSMDDWRVIMRCIELEIMRKDGERNETRFEMLA